MNLKIKQTTLQNDDKKEGNILKDLNAQKFYGYEILVESTLKYFFKITLSSCLK